jgi:pimeloyl-ACP methyl ester carboxylesterase
MDTMISIDGTVIAYDKRGMGPPLLLVHGATVDHRIWGMLSPHLESHFTIYAMDRRGRGASGDSPEYDLMREAEDVACLSKAIGEPVILFGHSFGALCTLEGALLTNKVSRLILYEPPIPTGVPSLAAGFPERLQTLIDAGELEAALALFLRDGARMPEHELDAYRQSPMWQATLPITPTIPREIAVDRNYQFKAERFAALQVPTLLLLGAESPPFYRQGIEAVNAALPDSTIVILPGQQHVAHLAVPELLAREVLDFLLAEVPVG